MPLGAGEHPGIYVTSKFVFWWREAVTFHYLASQGLNSADRRFQPTHPGRCRAVYQSHGNHRFDCGEFHFYAHRVRTDFVGPQQWSAIAIPVGHSRFARSGCASSRVLADFLCPGWSVSNCRSLSTKSSCRGRIQGKNSSVVRMIQGSTKRNKSLRSCLHPIRTNWNRLYYYNAFFDIWKHFYLVNVWMVPFLVLVRGCLSD